MREWNPLVLGYALFNFKTTQRFKYSLYICGLMYKQAIITKRQVPD